MYIIDYSIWTTPFEMYYAVPYFELPADFDGRAVYKAWKEPGSAATILHLFDQNTFYELLDDMGKAGIMLRLMERRPCPMFYNKNWQIGYGMEKLRR